ncbi:hypothetical protein C8R44DRAFT_895363 [Mycena epipterygia]|nr:hypothetical protein C8R44DRAFT_895363 [Mycena epipterygia]
MVKVLLLVSFVSLATSGLSLFQARPRNADEMFSILKTGGSVFISKMNAVDEAITSLNSNSNVFDLMTLHQATSECQQALASLIYYTKLQASMPYEDRSGEILLANLEAYNSAATNVFRDFRLKKECIQDIYPAALHKACDEIRWGRKVGGEFIDTIRMAVPTEIAQKASAVMNAIFAKMDTTLKECPADIVGVSGFEL